MTEPKWELTLSVTDRNNIGLIQPRKNNTNSELMRVHVTNKNGEPYDLTALKVFFVTDFLDKDGLNNPVQKEATVINAEEGIFEFVFDEDCMQRPGLQTAYFEIYDYDKFLDTTQNFTYQIVSSSRDVKADFKANLDTWAEAEKMLNEGTAKNLNDRVEHLGLTKANILDVNEQIRQQNQDVDNKLEKKTENTTFVEITADLQRQIESTQSGLIGEYDNEAQLKAAHPNGAKGYALVWFTENGKKVAYSYTYKNKTWVKGQIWNGMGIPENSVSNENLIDKTIALDKTRFTDISELNIFDGKFTKAYIMLDLKVLHLSSDTKYRFAVAKVEPQKKYTVMRKRGIATRNGIYFSNETPKEGLQLQGSEVTMIVYQNPDYEYYTFTVPAGMSYVYHYLGDKETPIQISKGEMPNNFIKNASKLLGTVEIEKELVSENISIGKNIFNQKWQSGYIGGPKGKKTGNLVINKNSPAKFAILEIKPFTFYSISKTQSDRFRIALTNEVPRENAEIWDMLTGDEDNNKNEFTFFSEDNKFLGMFFANLSEAPKFVQVEESKEVTDWETYGFKFHPQAKPINLTAESVLPNTPEYFGAKGFKVFSKDRKCWEDEAMTIPATDDTEAFKMLFENADGAIYLSVGKKYLVSETLQFDPSKIKYINGQGATIYGKGDIPIMVAKGSTTGNGGTIGAANQIRTELYPIIENLSITNIKKFEGIGFRVTQCLGLILKSCSIYQCKTNYQILGNNRNLFIDSCHIYNGLHNIHFESGSEVHQLLISNSMVLFGRINLFFENSRVFNMTISNCDIETDDDFKDTEYLTTDCNIKILALTPNSIYEDVKFTSSTVECHRATKNLAHIESDNPNKVIGLMLNDIEFGNANGNDVYLKNASGTSIVGCVSKYGTAASIRLDGEIRGLTLANMTQIEGDSILKCDDGAILKRLNVNGNSTLSTKANTIDLSNAASVEDSLFYGNISNGVLLPENATNVKEFNNI